MSEHALNILHFSTSDANGGAAQAAFRLHRALAAAGQSSKLIVRQKLTDAGDVEEVPPHLNVWRARARRLTRRFPPTGPPAFDLDVTPDIERDRFYRQGDVDVLVLHFVTRLLTVREIRRLHEHYGVPVVWALADQAPLTGGCHYSYDCDGYTKRCGRCPQLASGREDDRSRATWTRKHELLRGLPITFVSPSGGAADWVRRSSVFGDHAVELIPAISDPETFRPFDRRAARELLHVPADAEVVLIGAGDLLHARKGVREHGLPTLRRLHEGRPNLFVLALGGGGEELLAELPCPGRALGMLHDEPAIALAFQAADAFLCTSVADAGPLMIPESLLCGTPVVAFDVGYAVDLVEDGRTGHVVRSRDPDDLARALASVLDAAPGMRDACAAAALGHAPQAVAARHIALYRRLLA